MPPASGNPEPPPDIAITGCSPQWARSAFSKEIGRRLPAKEDVTRSDECPDAPGLDRDQRLSFVAF